MARTYSFSSYDKYLSLHMSFMMWAVLLFLTRPFVVLIISVVNRKDPAMLINMVYADRLAMILAGFAAIPAIVVVAAFIKRKPDASARIRGLWARGKWFLLASTVLNIFIVFLPLLAGWADKINRIGWVQFGISVAIVFYLFTDERLRDTFADFPQPLEEDAGKKSS